MQTHWYKDGMGRNIQRQHFQNSINQYAIEIVKYMKYAWFSGHSNIETCFFFKLTRNTQLMNWKWSRRDLKILKTHFCTAGRDFKLIIFQHKFMLRHIYRMSRHFSTCLLIRSEPFWDPSFGFLVIRFDFNEAQFPPSFDQLIGLGNQFLQKINWRNKKG